MKGLYYAMWRQQIGERERNNNLPDYKTAVNFEED